MINFFRTAAVAVVVSCLPAVVSATTFTLDFGNVRAANFTTTGLIKYSGVASGLNATLTANNSFSSKSPNNNGSVSGDIRVNLFADNTANLTLSLFDANAGNGFESLYNPGQNYDWAMGFYDIDGYTPENSYYDIVTVASTGGGDLSYTLTDTTDLVVTKSGNSVTFSAENAVAVDGQDGLSGQLNQAQSDVAAIINISNTSTLDFSYSVVGGASQARNMLVDGGTITLYGDTTTSPVPVPVPAAGLLMLGGLGLLGATRLRSRSRRA